MENFKLLHVSVIMLFLLLCGCMSQQEKRLHNTIYYAQKEELSAMSRMLPENPAFKGSVYMDILVYRAMLDILKKSTGGTLKIPKLVMASGGLFTSYNLEGEELPGKSIRLDVYWVAESPTLKGIELVSTKTDNIIFLEVSRFYKKVNEKRAEEYVDFFAKYRWEESDVKRSLLSEEQYKIRLILDDGTRTPLVCIHGVEYDDSE